MTYLRHLAARTLNQLPAVQPRLPSRFETARRAAGDDTPVSPDYAAFTPTPPSITAGAASFTSAPPTESRSAPEHTPAPPTIHASTVTLPPVMKDQPVGARHVHPDENLRAEKTDRDAPPPPAPVIAHNTVTHLIERAADTIVLNPTLIDHTTTLEARTLIERERIASPAAAPVETPAPRRAPMVTPYAPPPAQPPAAAPEPAPTIHVSIGRIEVRAVHAPATTPDPAPAPRHRVLSLDEYLRGVRT